MKKRRIFALWLAVVLLLTGCGGNEEKQDNSLKPQTSEMGRYVENTVELPEKLQFYSGLIKKQDGGLELYGYGGADGVCFYTSENGMDWKKQETPDWLKTGEEENVEMVRLGEDGCYYAVITEYGEEDGIGCMRQHILKSTDGKIGKELNLPVLQEVLNEGDDYRLYDHFSDLRVLENGSLAGMGAYGDSVGIFSQEGEELFEVDIVNSELASTIDESFAVWGNTIIGVKKNGKELGFVDGTTGKEIRSVEFPFSRSRNIGVLQDGTVLIADKNGIHRLEPEGTLWQTVVDGELNSMSMPTMWIKSFLPLEGESEEYLVLYEEGLYLYSYDAKVAAVPEQELNIYSLRENATLRLAAALFQQKHKDVRVNYSVGMERDSKDNKNDYIRAFNTELMSGDSADIILLDDLPYASYVEKGILKELSEIIDTETLLPQLSEAAEHKEGIYGLPLKFTLPVVIGKEEAVESSRELTTLFSYIKDKEEKNYIRMARKYNLLDYFISLYRERLFTEDGRVREDELKVFLENMLIFFENSGVNESEPAEFRSNLSEESRLNVYSNPASLVTGMAEACLATEGSYDGFFMLEALREKLGAVQWDVFGNRLIAQGRVGLNVQTKNKELAEEFMQFLFSEEVQGTNVFDGFPVNVAVLEKMTEEKPQEELSSMASMRDENGREVVLGGGYPKKKTKQEVLEKIKAAGEITGPVDTLHNMLLEEIIPLINGEKSVEETIKVLGNKVNTYLEEQK